MLSENKKSLNTCRSKFERPKLSEPITVRIKFCKTGNLQFISHLDLQRTFHRVLIRAKIPMWYTNGFNPHAKLVFAMPLSIGCESICEMADLRIEREISNEEIKEQLNSQLTDEMYVIDVYSSERKFNDIAFAEYDITINSQKASDEYAKKINNLFSSPLTIIKKTKSGEKQEDITQYIKLIKAEYLNNKININTVLATGSVKNLNPEYIISAIKDNTDLFCGNLMLENYSVMRKKFFDSDMIEFM